MKKSILIPLSFVFVSTLLLSGCGDGSASKKLSVFPFNTAVIKYELSGSFTGEENLYIKGDLMSSHKYIMQNDAEESTLELSLGSEKYIANLNKMTAIKTKNEQYDKLITLGKEDQNKLLILSALGLKDSDPIPSSSGTKKIAGQTCDVYVIENVGTACMWNGLVLEKKITILGISNDKTAVSIELDKDISNDRFELPAGVIVTN